MARRSAPPQHVSTEGVPQSMWVHIGRHTLATAYGFDDATDAALVSGPREG